MSRGLPVLVLETDEPLQGLLDAVLRPDGFEPTFVQDGKAALHLLARREFAAFLVDVSIAPSTLEEGVWRGVGFIHRLQRDNPALLARVVVLTGLPDRDLPRDLPRVQLLRKPFDIDALRAAVSEASGVLRVCG